jgi:hypothetical protein
VLVVDVDALQAVDFLDFVHQVFLQFGLAQHVQDVVRIAVACLRLLPVVAALPGSCGSPELVPAVL